LAWVGLIAEGDRDEESYELRKLIQMLNEIDKDQIDEIYVEDFMHGSTEIFISMKEKEVSYELDGRE
jgi:hypothetical protein